MKKYTVEVNGTDYEVIIKDSDQEQEEKQDAKINQQQASSSVIKEEGVDTRKEITKEVTEKVKPKRIKVDNSEELVTVKAPMSGKILSIKHDVGQTIEAGKTIITLEAMKMETEISAPVSGEIKAIKVGEGDKCKSGAVIALIEEAS